MLKGHGSVAQLGEHKTFNLGVAGSIPATLTTSRNLNLTRLGNRDIIKMLKERGFGYKLRPITTVKILIRIADGW